MREEYVQQFLTDIRDIMTYKQSSEYVNERMIQTENTPNPNSLKFLSEKIISAIGTEEFQREKAKNLSNPFIKELLEFKGVELVLLSKNFLSFKTSLPSKHLNSALLQAFMKLLYL